jgi:DNA repair exonuclease SbcCD ATPase subunit
MTADKDSERFQLRVDPDTCESAIHSEIEELKVEKLSQRVTLIAVLVPFLVIVVLVIAYLDIRKRVIQLENTGTMGVQKVATDLESRFSSLSVKQARLEDALDKASAVLDKSSASVSVQVKRVQETLKKLDQSKADQKALTRLTEKMDHFGKSTGTMDKRLTDMEGDMNERIAILNGSLEKTAKTLTQLQQDLQGLKEQQFTRNDLDLALKLESLRYQQQLKDRSQQLESRIANLSQSVEELTQTVKQLQTQSSQTLGSQVKKPPAKPLTGSQPPAKNDKDANQETILEQDLK